MEGKNWYHIRVDHDVFWTDCHWAGGLNEVTAVPDMV
jgi:hypothetical protein